MKQKAFGLFIGATLMFVVNIAVAEGTDFVDKTHSPYFFIKSEDTAIDRLPLKSTFADVNIAGVIADVVVTQVYKNEGDKPIEAIYVFPASTRAAVYGMKMTIGERIISAKIRKRDEARKTYEKAKQAGKSASLLEQHRPNVFEMNVANILPSDVIKVELRYTELLVPTDDIYAFVYPTVVGPRYAGRTDSESFSSEKWISNPYLHEGEAPNYAFHMTINLDAGLPIQDVTSPSHNVNITYKGKSSASIALDPAEESGGNRDFILKYRLAGEKIDSGLLLYKGKEENFFLLMVQPPKEVKDVHIPPREYLFVVDISGSMHGFPLDISKKLLKNLIKGLRPSDKFNVLLFAGSSSVLAERSLPATAENIKRAINLIERQRGGGGTELLPALKRTLSLPQSKGYSRSVVIVTDGYVTVEEEVFELIRNRLGEANMFTFGIGSSVNRYIIEGMARVGMGEPFVIIKPEDALEKVERFRKLIQFPVLTNIKIDYNRFEVYDLEPPSVPDLLAERPAVVFGKWHGKPRSTIHIQGITGNRLYKKKIKVDAVNPSLTNKALRYLWARHRIAFLSDFNRLKSKNERIAKVTNLGLKYNLLTAYTSFVAIDTRIRQKNGQITTVTQPLPLPKGVSDYAIAQRSAKSLGKNFAPASPRRPHQVRERQIISEFKKHEEGVADESVLSRDSQEASHVNLEKITVTEGLPKMVIRSLVKQKIRFIEQCYQQILKKNSEIRGNILFFVEINSAGDITNIKVEKREMKNKRLEQCIIENLKLIRFPAIKDQINGKITLIFHVN